jgi:peroxiredoxin
MSSLLRRGVVAFVVLAVLGAVPARAQQPTPADVDKLNKKIDSFSLKDSTGKPFTLADLKDKKAIVVVFLSFNCPVSNGYSPTLTSLHSDYASKGVAFVGINASDDLTAAEVAKNAADYKLPFTALKDDGFKAADVFKAKISPEAFVLDHNHVLRYRGRIDNSYTARLKKAPKTTEHNLKNALDDLLAGKAVRSPSTQAIGCPIQRERVVKANGKVTYYHDVLPILQTHCQQCHRPGEVGPFALMTYKQAVAWGNDIKEYTQSRKMPPWKPVEGVAFHNQRKLSDQELKTLASWVDDDMPAGNAKDTPKPRSFTEGWQLGKPDLVLTVPSDMTVGASGKDLFRCFVLPTGLTEDKYVIGLEVRPGNKRIVHHTLNFFDKTGQARKLEQREKDRTRKPNEQDFGPGYSASMGVGFLPIRGTGTFGGLGGWAPGQQARRLPAGYGYPLPKGSDVVVQTHYHRNGRVEKDRLTIGLYFAKDNTGIKPFKNAVIPGRFLAIPAGASKYRVTGAIVCEEDGELQSVMPHMHMLGKEIKVTMTPPGGKAQTLLNITDWDYNWQETYFLDRPIKFKNGTKFNVEAIYDNSDKNPNNPFNPPQWVRFGEQTDNEMCFVFLGVTNNDTTQRRFRFHAEGLGGLRLRRDSRDDKK